MQPTRTYRNTIEEFWRRVKKSDGCWEWTRGRCAGGYGSFKWQGVQVYAHRLSWELTNGPIPPGLFVLHSCDNPPCCNPAHLRVGTQAENIDDRQSRGRHRTNPPRGEAHGRARLTECTVREIRRRHCDGETVREIALSMDLNKNTVWHVANWTTWRHLGAS